MTDVGRWARLLIAAAGVLVMAGWLAPATARAHAQLVSVTPANGDVVVAPPVEVLLTFNEPVSLTGGTARVFDDDATQVSAPAVQSGVTISVPLDPELPDGTYTVTWEVVSGDSHRIAGASVFHVGQASSDGLDIGTITGADVAWGIRLGAAALSGIAYAGALVAFGTWAFRELVDRPGADGARHVNLRTVITRAAVLGAVTLVGAVPFRIARVGGGLDALRDNDVLTAELQGPIGQAAAVTAVALLAFAAAVERRAAGWFAGPIGLVAIAGFALEGHSRAIHLRWAMVTSDVIHAAAGAVWLAGIVALVLAFRRDVTALALAVLVRRFSSVALLAVGVVAVSGVLMAWIVLPNAGALTSTGYGLALVVKVSLVVVVIGLGAFNRWLLVPVVSAARAEGSLPSRRRSVLSQIVQLEMVLLLAVVGTTAVLVTRSPVASSSLPAPVGDGSGSPTTVPPQTATIETSDGGTVELSLSPGRVGPNTVSLVLRDAEGRVINPIEAPVVELSHAALGIGPLRPEATPVDIGEYTVSAELAVAGEWDVLVRIRVSDFVSVSGTTTVAIE